MKKTTPTTLLDTIRTSQDGKAIAKSVQVSVSNWFTAIQADLDVASMVKSGMAE